MSKRFFVIALAIALGFLNFSAIEAKRSGKKRKKTKIAFEVENCTRHEGEPDIYICLKGDAGQSVFNEHRLKFVNSKIVDLVNNYKQKSQAKQVSPAVMLDMSDPATMDPNSEEYCMMMYGMSCSDYDDMMNPVDTTTDTSALNPNSEEYCQMMYGMSCSDYDDMMNTMDTTTDTSTMDPNSDEYCQMMYGMSCADYDTMMGI